MVNIPDWAEEMKTVYKIGNYHQFLIDGNIRDLVFHDINSENNRGTYCSLRQFLIDMLFDGGFGKNTAIQNQNQI